MPQLGARKLPAWRWPEKQVRCRAIDIRFCSIMEAVDSGEAGGINKFGLRQGRLQI